MTFRYGPSTTPGVPVPDTRPLSGKVEQAARRLARNAMQRSLNMMTPGLAAHHPAALDAAPKRRLPLHTLARWRRFAAPEAMDAAGG